jgi:hypothetical protein
MAFLGKVLIFLLLVALCIAVGTLCLLLIDLARDDLKDLGIIKDKDAIKDAYQRGLTTGRLLANKYPMGQYTFPIACSRCENLGSDKCYRCKAEQESGFKLKVVTNDEADTV